MNKNRYIFLFLCMSVCLSAQALESSKSWKVAAEHFESLYFKSLQESLQESKPTPQNAASINYLKQALVVYHQQAKNGDADAQFRLGVIYEKSVPSQSENAKHWYQQAAAQGHSYATDRLKAVSRPNDQSKCELYGNLLLSLSMIDPKILFHVESLALLGHEDCMLALGHAGSYYWLQRAALTPSTSALQGESLYALGLAEEEKCGSNCRSVISLMERSSRYMFTEARDWLDEQRSVDGMSAYILFLKSRKQIAFPAYLAKSLMQNSSSWNESDRYKAVASETTTMAYAKNLNQAVQDLEVDDVQLIFAVIGSIAEALVRETKIPQTHYDDFIDSVLSLYGELGEQKNEDLRVARFFLQFLKKAAGAGIYKEKQFLLLSKSLQALGEESLNKLNQEYDIVGLSASLLQPSKKPLKVDSLSYLRQLSAALELRRVLLPIGELGKLDNAFRHAALSFGQDESALKAVLQIAKEKDSPELFLLFFKNLFANELAQLDILMQVEDLLSAVNWASKDKNQAYKMVDFLAAAQASSIPMFKESSFDGFPKLKLWNESGFLLKDLELKHQNSLFAESLLNLQAYAMAVKNHQKTGFYFMSYELAATLSPKHIDAVRNGFESRLNRLSELKNDFKQNRNEKEFVEDAQVSKILFDESLQNSLALKTQQLKQYVLELLATQKTLNAQLNYAGLYGERKATLQTSNGLKIFQKVAGESDDFTVSPNDAKMSPAFMALSDLARFSHRSVELSKNEVLNIQVSGEWSPTCALKRSGVVEDVFGIRVGSEGFRAQVSSGDNLVVGNDQRTSVSQFSQESTSHGGGIDWVKTACMIVGVIAGGPTGILIGAAVATLSPFISPFSYSSSFQKTSGSSTSSEKSQYEQASKFKSNTAAFQSGMRLIHTPYPQLPAGAYVAIVVSREPGNLGQVTHQLVLQSHNSIVAAQDSQVFFVVNDCNDGHAEKGSLVVHLQKLQPTSSEVAKLVDAMEKNLRLFAQKGEALVKEGGDLSARIETLKADVVADLQLNSIVDFMSQPTLRSVFLQWLHHEADNTVRKARIAELVRNIYSVKMEVEGMQNQRKTNNQHENQLSSRLSRLVKSTKHLVIYDSILEVAKYATQFLMPILQLYYPKKTEFLSKNAYGPHIVDAQKMLDLEVMTDTVEHFSKQLLRGLGAELISATTAEYVMVRIPRPGIILTEAQRKLVPVIAEDRAQIFWDHLFRKDLKLESWGLKLEFEDLYQDVRQGGLFSNQEAPVIIDMALFLAHDDIFATEYLQTQFPLSAVDMVVGRDQVFPLLKGPKKLVLSNDDLRSYKISLGFMSAQQLVSDAVSHIRNEVVLNLNTAKGLSPFSAFSFAQESGALLENMQKDLGLEEDGYPSHLTDIFIVMKVVSSNGYDSMKWLHSKDLK